MLTKTALPVKKYFLRAKAGASIMGPLLHSTWRASGPRSKAGFRALINSQELETLLRAKVACLSERHDDHIKDDFLRRTHRCYYALPSLNQP
ncbi:unnamed protein product [Nezara viridula]|uniref:Uncharacterized protein n=1 Tax=Nezara viridula TaxID=85310 RepID=A0A9P0HJB5_NEZVI|nr:unnamed protein product [Nezara viridula]